MSDPGTAQPGGHPVGPGLRLTDPGQIEATLQQAFGTSMRLTGSRNGYLFARRRLVDGPVVIDQMCSSGFSVTLEPVAGLHVVTGLRGAIDRVGRAGTDRIGPGQTALSLPEEGYRCEWIGPDARVQAVVLDPALLAEVAADDPAAVAPVRFTGTRAVTPAAESTWRRTVDHVTGTVFADPTAAASPLLVGGVRRLLAALALTSFPNTAAAPAFLQQTSRDAVDASPTTLRRAVDHIDAHADLDLGVADIALAAGVSVRAVQLAFRRHLDTTPMRYLRRVRLARAHAQLSEAAPGDGTTVTGVAVRWGFSSASRFAALYRAAYSVSPRDTLRTTSRP